MDCVQRNAQEALQNTSVCFPTILYTVLEIFSICKSRLHVSERFCSMVGRCVFGARGKGLLCSYASLYVMGHAKGKIGGGSLNQ